MLGQLCDGETLVVTKLGRLGRDAQDVGATIKMPRRIAVIVLQLGKLNLTSAASKLILTMLAAVAEIERSLLVERTRSRPGAREGREQDPGPAGQDDPGPARGDREAAQGRGVDQRAGSGAQCSRASVMPIVTPAA